jgi:hypothetical protein
MIASAMTKHAGVPVKCAAFLAKRCEEFVAVGHGSDSSDDGREPVARRVNVARFETCAYG